ncbi:MAG: DUF2922 domain-containing protein [Synergistaceae bacterium]|jgi:hypothetical protein|nr:DUF2922 domain-containing protein [Synergistaceae bacterium]
METFTRKLAMKFGTDDSKTKIITVQPCKEDVGASQAHDAMDVIVSSGVFAFAPVEKLGASVTEQTVTKLF